MGLYANLRPARLLPQLAQASPLKSEITGKGVDFVVVWELIGGIYFGEHRTKTVDGQKLAVDIMRYSRSEIERITRVAFEAARGRRRKVTSVDKRNVLDCSRLWRETMKQVAADYPDVTLEHMLVDNCAMQIVLNPAQFDVVLTENMFGGILSDKASMVTGSVGVPLRQSGRGQPGAL